MYGYWLLVTLKWEREESSCGDFDASFLDGYLHRIEVSEWLM